MIKWNKLYLWIQYKARRKLISFNATECASSSKKYCIGMYMNNEWIILKVVNIYTFRKTFEVIKYLNKGMFKFKQEFLYKKFVLFK